MAKKRYKVTGRTSVFGEETVTVRDTDTGEWVDLDVHRQTDMLGNRSTTYTHRYSSREQRRDAQESAAGFGIFAVVVIGGCLLILLAAALYSAVPKLILSAGTTAFQWVSDIGEMARTGQLRWGEIVFIAVALLGAVMANYGRAREKDQKEIEAGNETMVLLFAAAFMSLFCLIPLWMSGLEENGYPAGSIADLFPSTARYFNDTVAKSGLLLTILMCAATLLLMELFTLIAMLPVMLALSSVLSIPFILCGRRKNLIMPAWAGVWLGLTAIFLGLEAVIPGVIHFLKGLADAIGSLFDYIFGMFRPFGITAGTADLPFLAQVPSWALLAAGAILLFVCARWLIRHWNK